MKSVRNWTATFFIINLLLYSTAMDLKRSNQDVIQKWTFSFNSRALTEHHVFRNYSHFLHFPPFVRHKATAEMNNILKKRIAFEFISLRSTILSVCSIWPWASISGWNSIYNRKNSITLNIKYLVLNRGKHLFNLFQFPESELWFTLNWHI